MDGCCVTLYDPRSGTGLVHSAPAFGEDDYRVGLANGIVEKGKRKPSQKHIRVACHPACQPLGSPETTLAWLIVLARSAALIKRSRGFSPACTRFCCCACCLERAAHLEYLLPV